MTAVFPSPGQPRGTTAPVRRPEHRRSQHLRPVERPRPKRSPAVPALVGVGMVIAALLALAGMHAVLIGGQVRLDAMRSDVAAENEAIRRLELRVAELESPDRVLDAARDRLGMVLPTEVGYLLPVGVEGAATEPVRVDAAVAPEPTADEATSPEQAAVDAAEVAPTDDSSEGGREE